MYTCTEMFSKVWPSLLAHMDIHTYKCYDTSGWHALIAFTSYLIAIRLMAVDVAKEEKKANIAASLTPSSLFCLSSLQYCWSVFQVVCVYYF